MATLGKKEAELRCLVTSQIGLSNPGGNTEYREQNK
jgi:hypothetical protein